TTLSAINQSTLLNVIPELAAKFINNERRKLANGELGPRDPETFSRKLLQLRVDLEAKLPRNITFVFDRGLPDSLGYYRLCGQSEADFEGLELRRRYRQVFFFEPTPWEYDGVRNEFDYVNREFIHNSLRATYESLDYDIIDVPVMPVEERVQFVLQNISCLMTSDERLQYRTL
ncbi:MAG: AAA family ATPase, partial [Bdellovibrionota bacterium]